MGKNVKKLIPFESPKYKDIDFYYIEKEQLLIYKGRERLEAKNIGYAGIYDFNLNKVIIEPNKYREIELLRL